MSRTRGLARAILLAGSVLYWTVAPGQQTPPAPPTGLPPIRAERVNENPVAVQDREATPREGFNPTIELSETYVDNVTLATSNQPKTSSYITQLIPGFTYDVARGRIEASANLALQGVHYSDDGGRDQVFGHFSGIARGEVLSDLFYIQATGFAGQQVVSPTAPTFTLDSILDTNGNIVNAYSAALTPFLRKRFAGTVFNARYTDGFVRYQNVGPSEAVAGVPLSSLNSHNRETFASWGTDERNPDRFTWEASYDRQQADYEQAPSFVYDRGQLQLGFQIVPRLTLLALGGRETEILPTTAGSFSHANFWQAGFDYQASREHELRILAGHRFFGPAYTFLYRYTGRRLSLTATYNETPTTAAQELALRPVTEPGAPAPTAGTGLLGISPEVFIAKYADVRARLEGHLTTITVDGGYWRRVFPATPNINERTVLAALSISRRLGPRSALRFRYAYRDVELGQIAFGTNKFTSFRLEWLRTLTRDFTLGVGVGHLRQNVAPEYYDVNFALIRIGKAF